MFLLLQHKTGTLIPLFDNQINALSHFLTLIFLCLSISITTFDFRRSVVSPIPGRYLYLFFGFLKSSVSLVLALKRDFVNFKTKLYFEIGNNSRPKISTITSMTPPRSPMRSMRLKIYLLWSTASDCKNKLHRKSWPGYLSGNNGLLTKLLI